jgi:hypothetical protein
MRKFLIPLMMASALMPAGAMAKDRSFVDAIRERGQHQSSDDNDNGNQRQSRQERTVRVERNNDAPRIERIERSQRSEDGNRDRQVQVRRFEGQQPQQQQQQQDARQYRRSDSDILNGVRDAARDGRLDDRRIETRRDNNDGRGFEGMRDRIVRNGDRVDTNRRWSNDWRRDHRYDWRSYRDRNRSIFRIGRYYDPYGWGYRRFSIGFNLWPSYYSSNFWLDDPYMYRLPPAYGPYRWVRYYDDALLVNIYTGQVVDVLYSFFW